MLPVWVSTPRRVGNPDTSAAIGAGGAQAGLRARARPMICSRGRRVAAAAHAGVAGRFDTRLDQERVFGSLPKVVEREQIAK